MFHHTLSLIFLFLNACNPDSAVTFISPFYLCCLHFSSFDDSALHSHFIVLHFPSPLGFLSSFKEKLIKECTETIIQSKAGNILYGRRDKHEVKFRRKHKNDCSSLVLSALFTLKRLSRFISCISFLFVLKSKKVFFDYTVVKLLHITTNCISHPGKIRTAIISQRNAVHV